MIGLLQNIYTDRGTVKRIIEGGLVRKISNLGSLTLIFVFLLEVVIDKIDVTSEF